MEKGLKKTQKISAETQALLTSMMKKAGISQSQQTMIIREVNKTGTVEVPSQKPQTGKQIANRNLSHSSAARPQRDRGKKTESTIRREQAELQIKQSRNLTYQQPPDMSKEKERYIRQQEARCLALSFVEQDEKRIDAQKRPHPNLDAEKLNMGHDFYNVFEGK